MCVRRNIIILLLLALVLLGSGALAIDTGTVSNYAPDSQVYGGSQEFFIVLKDAELKEALRFLAKAVDTNIVIPEGITGVVNVRFDGVRVLDAINSIIKANDLDYAIERGVLRVGKSGQFATTGEDLKTETIRLRYATAKDMVDKVKSLLTDRGSVLADERTNSLVVRERLANIDNVKRFLQDIDVRDAQVRIEAKIAEVTRDFSRNLGIQWGANSTANKVNVVGLDGVGQSDNDRNLNVNLGATGATSGIGLLIGTLAGGLNIDIQLTAAEQRGDAKIISEPTIVTSNGVTAKIRSGETMLIRTTGDLNIGSGGVSGDTGLHEIETGVELQVTPQISVNGLVKMKIDAMTSQADFSREVEGIPVILDNTATTEVLMLDGQTTVIGGLFKFVGSDSIRSVPFFSKLPLLGNLFKSKSKQNRNTELMIFIKPTIVRPLDEVLEYNAEAEQANNIKKGMVVAPLEAKEKVPVSDTRESRASRRNPHLMYRDDKE